VVYFHGSDGDLTREVPVARFLHTLGVNALLVEYPGYCGDGARPSERGCYLAADAGWEHVVRQRAVNPQQIILFGHSLGGAAATYLAARTACGGLVIHSGFTSVPDLAARVFPYLPVRPFCRTRMDSLARIGLCRAPVLMIHSADDEHVPIDNARRLYGRAPGPKRFIVLRGSHWGTPWQNQSPVLDAWRQLLGSRTASWEAGVPAASETGAGR
jgi:pimeloyl-ACP methyl ester carboxylesterase